MSDSRIFFDSSAYSYSQGLLALGLMFEAARNALTAQNMDLASKIKDYQASIDDGGDPIGEWDADGHRIWEQDQLFRFDQLAITDALEELKSATVIAIYHHWERHMPGEENKKRRVYEDLKSSADKHSIPLHENIRALYLCGVYLKHGNEEKRAELVKHWPDRFRTPRQTKEPVAWYRNLKFGSDEIEWFLEIARCSQRPISSSGAQ